MKIKILLLIVISLILTTKISAQQLLGVSNSTYSGTDGIYLNPSFISGSPYKVFIKLFSTQLGVTNDYVKYTSSLYGSDVVFDQTTLEENKNGKPKNANIYVDLKLPSFMFRINSRMDIGLVSRLRQRQVAIFPKKSQSNWLIILIQINF